MTVAKSRAACCIIGVLSLVVAGILKGQSSQLHPSVRAATMTITATTNTNNITKTATATTTLPNSATNTTTTTRKVPVAELAVAFQGSELSEDGNKRAKYAYVFVIGGCFPGRSGYHGYLHNIMVAARLFQEFGSQADIVAYFQISSKSNETKLPDSEAKALEALGVKVRYLSKETVENFYGIQMRKFDILKMTEYRRVLFLDGDVIPTGNLDYLFHLSDHDGPENVLKENVVLMSFNSPGNGGFFMVRPSMDRYEQLQEIIRKREETVIVHEDSNDGLFDVVKGWGHVIEPPDHWETKRENGTNWTFYGAFVDQGLLYHYVKYVQKSVSIVRDNKGTVENWGTLANGTLVKEGIVKDVFVNHSRPVVRGNCYKWLCDFHHFTGSGKPWNQQAPPAVTNNRPQNAFQLWWHTLRNISDDLSLGLDFVDRKKEDPPLGYWAPLGMMKERTRVNRTAAAIQRKRQQT